MKTTCKPKASGASRASCKKEKQTCWNILPLPSRCSSAGFFSAAASIVSDCSVGVFSLVVGPFLFPVLLGGMLCASQDVPPGFSFLVTKLFRNCGNVDFILVYERIILPLITYKKAFLLWTKPFTTTRHNKSSLKWLVKLVISTPFDIWKALWPALSWMQCPLTRPLVAWWTPSYFIKIRKQTWQTQSFRHGFHNFWDRDSFCLDCRCIRCLRIRISCPFQVPISSTAETIHL